MKLEPLILSYLNAYGEMCKGILISLICKLTGVSKISVKNRVDKLIQQSKIFQNDAWISTLRRVEGDNKRETIETNSIEISSEANIIHMKSTLTENELKKYKELSTLALPKIQKALDALLKNIERKILERYNPLDVLGYLTTKNLFVDPYLYSEPTSTGIELIPETIQNIILKNDFKIYKGNYRNSFAEIDELCKELIYHLESFIFVNSLQDCSLNDIEKEIYYHVFNNFLFVRGDAFTLHYKEIALELFSEINDFLLQKGFTIEEYFETVEEILKQINYNINEPKRRYNLERNLEKNLFKTKLRTYEGKVSDEEFRKIQTKLLAESKKRLAPYEEKLSELMSKEPFEIEVNEKINQNLLNFLYLNFGNNSAWNSPLDKTDTVIKPLIRTNEKFTAF